MYLSLCIPTNGIIEWVFPVLDSIYSQGISEEMFEVIVTDNGDNSEFKLKIAEYVDTHSNLVYKETSAAGFLNQVEAFKIASGELIKFVNHRATLKKGTLNYLLECAMQNTKDRPVIYFLNGALKMDFNIRKYGSFDEFVNALSYYSSWSAGLSIWKKDFEKIKFAKYDSLFPHTTWLFAEHSKQSYIIDNTVLFSDIPVDDTKKGKYNLWKAFGVHYISLVLDLYKEGDITYETFYKVKEENYKFIVSLVFQYKVMRRLCSYDLTGCRHWMSVYYSDRNVLVDIIKFICIRGVNKICRIVSFGGKNV